MQFDKYNSNEQKKYSDAMGLETRTIHYIISCILLKFFLKNMFWYGYWPINILFLGNITLERIFSFNLCNSIEYIL